MSSKSVRSGMSSNVNHRARGQCPAGIFTLTAQDMTSPKHMVFKIWCFQYKYTSDLILNDRRPTLQIPELWSDLHTIMSRAAAVCIWLTGCSGWSLLNQTLDTGRSALFSACEIICIYHFRWAELLIAKSTHTSTHFYMRLGNCLNCLSISVSEKPEEQ